MKWPVPRGRKSIASTALVVGAAAALSTMGVIGTANAQSGRRVCGHVWSAPAKANPDQLYVYLRFAKVKLNSPGCAQVHNDLDHNTFNNDYPEKSAEYGADIGEWTRNDFRETCEDFSVRYLQEPEGTDYCEQMKLWDTAPWALETASYNWFWTGAASDWHGVR
jgi:hypothetical protein